MKKLVLAYSGGLDTSYCAKFLSLQGYEVFAITVNTGGFSEQEIVDIKTKALKIGANSHESIDALDVFYTKVIRYLIFGNVLKNNTYPLSVSAERIVQAIEVVNYAQKIGASYIAHGSTGAGNDQVRFDMVFQILAPNIEIITPIRDLKLSRQEEIDYLKANGVDMAWDKAKYSINKGLWGTSVGGDETLTSSRPLPESAFPSSLEKTTPLELTLTFEKGEPVALNEKQDRPINIIKNLNAIASAYAIGRDIHVGDTIIGIKGRVGFEASAPLILIKAHHALEKHVLTKWQQHHKEYLSNWYGMLLHEGQYFDEVMRNIETFLADTQRFVSGVVFIKLHPYRFEIQGIESNHDLMTNTFGSYGEMNKRWTSDDAKGFIKINAMQNKIFRHVNRNTEE